MINWKNKSGKKFTIIRPNEINDGLKISKAQSIYVFPITQKVELFVNQFISFEECSSKYLKK